MSIFKHPDDIRKETYAVDSCILNTPQIVPNVGGGGSGGVATYISSGTSVNQIPHWVKHNYNTGGISDDQMIFMRLYNGQQYVSPDKGIEFISSYRVSPERVAVFVCNNGAYVVLEDDANLFPSDSLITQLRMLSK